MTVYINDSKAAAPSVNGQNSDNLLNHLRPGGAFAYLWRLPDRQSRYYPTGGAVPAATSSDVYFGVHPVTMRRPANERGRIEDVAAVNCLFAEFDVKDFGCKDAIREHLEARAALWPTFIVDSGGGWHCYWIQDLPHILRNYADRKAAAALQARFVTAIGGDKGAKDLARVLRLPGTLNAKYDPPRRVEIIEHWPNATYTHDELRQWVDYLAPVPVAQTAPAIETVDTANANEGIGGILATLAAQHEGQRNSVLYWAANRFRERDIPTCDADAMLTPIAKQLGLADVEISRTIQSAYRGAA